MRSEGISSNEKLRERARVAIETLNVLGHACYRYGVVTLVMYAGLVLGALLTCDPETATFRDFLLEMRSQAIWTTALSLSACWMGLRLIVSPPHHDHYWRKQYAVVKTAGSAGSRKDS